MRIFVTGGTGFIGKYLVPKLDNGKNKILILSRNSKFKSSKNITFLKGDISETDKWKNRLKRFRPEIAIHLAWEGIPDYGAENSLKNLINSFNLIKELIKVGCSTILSTGSAWEYGKNSGKLSEDIAIQPLNAFSAAKNSLNFLGRELAKENNVNFIWVRLFYVYGPGQKRDSLIPYLINCIKENKKMEIRNPLAKNDFIYIADVAEAISRLAFKEINGTFNIGSGKLTSVQYIIDKIFKVLNKKMKYQKAKQIQLDAFSYSYSDISKINKETGWKPETNMDSGIRETVKYFN